MEIALSRKIESLLEGKKFEWNIDDNNVRISSLDDTSDSYCGFKLRNLVLNSHESRFCPELLKIEIDLQELAEAIVLQSKKNFREKVQIEYDLDSSSRIWIWGKFREPGNKARHRGYGENLYGNHLPIGNAGICLRLLVVPFKGLSIVLEDIVSIGYTPSHLIERLFKSFDDLFSEFKNKKKQPHSRNLLVRFIEIQRVFEKLPILAKLEKQFPGAFQKIAEKIEAESTGLNHGKLHISFQSDKIPTQFNDLPLHIYESIKEDKELEKIDSLIIEDKMIDAGSELKQLVDNRTGQLIALRQAIVANFNLASLSPTGIGLVEEFCSEMLIGLSSLVKIDFNNGKDDYVIKRLTSIFKECQKIGIDIGRVKSFDTTFSELMGDAWRSINLEKSALSYRRVLQINDSEPRVLRKLIEVYRGLSDHKAEALILDRLIQSEPRKRDQAKLLNEKFNLLERNQVNNEYEIEKASIIELAYSIDPENSDVLKNYLNYLTESDRSILAQQIVDSVVEQNTFSNSFVSDILVFCAKNWIDQFDRIDLAEERIGLALDFNPDNLEAISLLKQTILKNPEKAGSLLARNVLRNSFDAEYTNSSIKVLELILDKGNFEKEDLQSLATLLVESTKKNRLYPKLLRKLYLNFTSPDFWRQNGKLLILKYLNNEKIVQFHEIHSILTDLIKRCVKDFEPQETLQLLKKALDHKISSIVDVLNIAKASGTLQSILNFIVPEKMGELTESELSILLDHSSGFKVGFRIKIVLELSRANPNWKQDLRKLLTKHYKELDLKDLNSGLKMFGKEILPDFDAYFWTLCKERLENLSDNDFRSMLLSYIQDVVDYELPRIGPKKIKDILSIISKADEKKLLIKAILNCVRLNIPVPLSITEVENSLQDEKDILFEYYIEKAKSLEVESRKIILLKAVKIKTIRKDLQEIRFELCLRSFQNGVLAISSDEFLELSQLLGKQEKFLLQVEQYLVRKFQIRALTLKEIKESLQFSLMILSHERDDNLRRIEFAIRYWMKFFDSKSDSLVPIIEALKFRSNPYLHFNIVSAFFQTILSNGSTSILRECIVSLQKFFSPADNVNLYFIDWWWKNGSSLNPVKACSVIEDIVGIFDFKNVEEKVMKSLNRNIELAIKSNDILLVERALILLAEHSGSRENCEESLKIVLKNYDTNSEKSRLFYDALGRLSTSTKAKEYAKETAELLWLANQFEWGEINFDLYIKMKEAFDKYAYASEIWVPLYYLTKTYGDMKFQKGFYEFLVIKVKENSSILKGHPISLESLTNEVRSLSEKLDSAEGKSLGLRSSVVVYESISELSPKLKSHIDFQIDILSNQNQKMMHQYQYKIWQDINRRFYGLNPKFDDPMFDKIIESEQKNSLLEELLAVHLKSFIKKHLEIFELPTKFPGTDILNVEMNQRKIDNWDHPVLLRSQILGFDEVFIESDFSVVEIASGSDEILYDPFRKTMYIDLAVYNSLPATSLRYELLNLILAIKDRDYVLLKLDPIKHVLPIIEESKKYLYMSRDKRMEHPDHELFKDLDVQVLSRNFNAIGTISEKMLIGFWESLKQKSILKLGLLTFDLIGILEWMTGKRIENIIQKKYLYKRELNSIDLVGDELKGFLTGIIKNEKVS